jgi:hypothetical protein
MPTLSRRGLFAAGSAAAAGAALAGCSEAKEPREDVDPQALTDAEAEAEVNLSGAYVTAAQVAAGKERVALEAFAEAAKGRAADLGSTSEPPGADGGPDAPEALSACINLANQAIAAHLQASGLLTEAEGRATAASFLAACAAEVAAVRGFAGEPEVPESFVTGGTEAPYESTDEPDTGEEE